MPSAIKPASAIRLATPRAADIVLILQSTCFALGILICAYGFWITDYVVEFTGTFLMLMSNVAFALLRLETRLMLLLLNLGMFLFWLTRPLFGITYFHDIAWMNNSTAAVEFSLFAIFLALFFTRLGNDCYELYAGRRKGYHLTKPREPNVDRAGQKLDRVLQNESLVKAIRHASLVIFAICYCGAIVRGYQEFAFSRLVSYETFHLTSTNEYSSSTLGTLSTMAPYAMCIYLATMPKKRPATVMLLLNIIRTVPVLLTGSRGEFVLAVIFLGFYYLMRAFVRHEKGWITKFEVALVVLGIPLGIFGMGVINYARGGIGLRPSSVLDMFCDSLYKQGVTFSILQYAYNADGQLQKFGFKFYTLGPLIHTITQGFVGQLFLGSELLPETNSIDLAVKGSSYAHSMSYITHWNYLGGEGYGTSFVLESFADFGYAGIAVVSTLLGAMMAFLSSRARVGGFASVTLALLAARNAFFLPRGEAVGWISFLWSTRFWLAIVIIAGFALFLYTRYTKTEIIAKRSASYQGAAQSLSLASDK